MNRAYYVKEAMKRGYMKSQLKGLTSQQLYALIMSTYGGYSGSYSSRGDLYRRSYGVSTLDESERQALAQYLKK